MKKNIPPNLSDAPKRTKRVNACPLCNSIQLYYSRIKKQYTCYNCHMPNITPIRRPKNIPFGSPKRDPKAMSLINRGDIDAIIRKVSGKGNKDIRNKAFVSFLYLTGARASEVTRKIRKRNFKVEAIQGIKYLIIENVTTLKRKKTVYRIIPLNYQKYKTLIDYIVLWLTKIQDPDAYLFDFGYKNAYKIVKEWTGLFPHFFRHLCLTHKVIEDGWGSQHLVQFTGWKDGRPAEHYIHLNYKDLARKDI